MENEPLLKWPLFRIGLFDRLLMEATALFPLSRLFVIGCARMIKTLGLDKGGEYATTCLAVYLPIAETYKDFYKFSQSLVENGGDLDQAIAINAAEIPHLRESFAKKAFRSDAAAAAATKKHEDRVARAEAQLEKAKRAAEGLRATLTV